jgi:hypothetical protein
MQKTFNISVTQSLTTVRVIQLELPFIKLSAHKTLSTGFKQKKETN